MVIKSKVYIHGGDYDCSEAVRMSYRAVDILPYGSYMWTGNERELLAEYGFIKVNMNHLERGDVLWKPGHTEMYLGNGVQGGARIAETGGITGKKGDQTGREIASSSYDLSYWQWKEAWRYFGSATVDGIPINEAAAQVMEHLINHDAHGYSQNNRAGDGTIEEITLVWDKDAKQRLIDVDGWIGVATITLAQQQMKMPYPDGKISGQDPDLRSYYPHIVSLDQWNRQGSMLVAAIQKKVGASVDGIIGPKTNLAVCDYIGCKKSKVIDYDTACAIQESLNDQRWAS